MKDKTKNVIFSALAMALLLSLALAASALPGRAESDQPDQVNYAYLPSVYSDPPGSLITGQVTSLDGVPIPGVTVTTQTGLKAVTDSEGIYIFKGLREDVYTLTPALSGMSFTPPSSQAVVPPKVLHMNFASIQACQDVIKNGGFESNSDWEFPITEYPAAYSSADVHTGSRSARTGITNPSDNKYSYSSIRQAVDIPSDATGAMLRLYLHPESGEFISGSLPLMPTGVQLESQIQAGDVQYVLVLDAYNNILETLFWGRFDTGWGFYEFNLIKWAGRTIKIHIGTYNDGLNGITAMYVDDVSMQLCSDGTPPPTTPPPSGACNNLISNSSFESISTWDIPITAYPAGYATAQAHTGSQSMRTGIINSADNRYSYSDFRQLVSIPSSFNPAILRLWTYTLSGEARSTQALPNSTPTGKPFGNTPLAGDVQYLLILDRYQNWIDTLLWQREDEGGWLYYEFDLRKYAGQTIYIQFGTYNDGWNGISAMYIDDVTLENCTITPTAGPSPTATRTPTATPTPLPTNTPTPTNTPLPTNTPRPTNTPGPCEELFDNVDFEDDDGWEIPITRYTAGYSTVQALSPIHSMRTGIVNPVDNTYSYSDFRQTVAIPLDADNVILGVWLYTLSGEVAEAPIPPIPNWERFGEEPLAGDVQYILILDRYGYWIDTLYWDRSDDGGWVYHEFDLSAYAGWVISVQFGTYNDGYSGVTAMYVDDASLGICP